MDPKEYLETYLMHVSRVEIFTQAVEYYKSELEHLPDLFVDVLGKNPDTLEFNTDFVRMCKSLKGYISRCEQNAEKYTQESEAVKGTIALVKDLRLQQVLTMRYVDNRTWYYIADEMFYCLEYVHQLHRKALKEVDRIINAETPK